MRVAICDDEKICRAQALDIATDYAEERQDREVVFEMFEESEALLQAIRAGAQFDILVLDIVMPGMNGIELGQALRDAGYDGKIIYLTSSEEYAIDSFRIRAFHYLLKPIERQSFFAAMDEAVNSIAIKKDRSLIVKTKESNARVTFDSLLYAELAKRSVVYHLTDGKTLESTTLRTTFTEAAQPLLADRRFAACGASMAVNLHHVTMVESEAIVFSNGEKVFLGKKACRDLRALWNEYWLSAEG